MESSPTAWAGLPSVAPSGCSSSYSGPAEVRHSEIHKPFPLITPNISQLCLRKTRPRWTSQKAREPGCPWIPWGSSTASFLSCKHLIWILIWLHIPEFILFCPWPSAVSKIWMIFITHLFCSLICISLIMILEASMMNIWSLEASQSSLDTTSILTFAKELKRLTLVLYSRKEKKINVCDKGSGSWWNIIF